MERREFVRLIGAGGIAAAVGAVVGAAGCRPTEGEGGAATEVGAQSAGEDTVRVVCPNCGAENHISALGPEITCWKCGHRWTPQAGA